MASGKMRHFQAHFLPSALVRENQLCSLTGGETCEMLYPASTQREGKTVPPSIIQGTRWDSWPEDLAVSLLGATPKRMKSISIRAANKHKPQTLAGFQGELLNFKLQNKGLPEIQLRPKSGTQHNLLCDRSHRTLMKDYSWESYIL